MNLINVIKWYEGQELDIFDGIVLPVGLDKDLVINTILDLSATYIPLYTDYDLFNMKNKVFFQRNLDNFTLMYQALKEEYNPLHNYDRYEDRDESNTFDETNTRTIDETLNRDISDNSNENNTNENKVSAFDSSSYQPKEQSTFNGSITKTSSDDSENKKTDNYTGNNTNKYITQNHIYGNIGVTTSQQMLESEIDLRIKYNIYEIIARMWYNEFMIRVEEVY